MTLQKELENLQNAMSDLGTVFKKEVATPFRKWFFGQKYALVVLFTMYLITLAYVLTSTYLTFIK